MAGKKKNTVNTFVFGAEEKFITAGSDDAVLLGTLRGKIQEGDEVILTNPGDDINTTFKSKIINIEVGLGNKQPEAEDCIVSITLEKSAKFNLKAGTVCYSENATAKEIRDSYINSIGNTYISNKNMDLKEINFDEMSIGDCVELWRLYSNLHSVLMQDNSEEAKKANAEKINAIAAAVCDKVLGADELLCVYSKATGKPYMFSNTIKTVKGTMVTPPDIRIYTKAYEDEIKELYSDSKYEIKTIKNSADGKDFLVFFGEAFYVDGVCGVDVVYPKTAVPAQMMIPQPDLSNNDPSQVPVVNPDMMRWLLLLTQLETPESDDAKVQYSMYYGMLSETVMNASFVIPMKAKNGKVQNGETYGSNNFSLPAFDGVNGRKAVYLYTDVKTVMEKYQGWGVIVRPISEVIEQYDCAINYTDGKTGLYIDKKRYDHMKALVDSAKAGKNGNK